MIMYTFIPIGIAAALAAYHFRRYKRTKQIKTLTGVIALLVLICLMIWFITQSWHIITYPTG